MLAVNADQHPLKVVLVAGARPNFIKIASLEAAMRARPEVFDPCLVHTGQHYDKKMSDVFFEELGIPKPDRNLGVGSGSHAKQTGEIMIRFEPVILEEKPDLVVVVGDVNSTIACTLVASKLGVPVAHVEAGLRSGDRGMPEETNRILTDSISDFLLVSEPSGVENLRREGVPDEKVFFVGNVMIDTLFKHRDRSVESKVLEDLGLEEKGYGVLTLHRPSNVDDPDAMSEIMTALEAVGSDLPLVFPTHPRTLGRIEESGLLDRLKAIPRIQLISPLGYLDFLRLQSSAKLVLTDSGGIQEETTALGVPCVTIRENTERPVTITDGTNILAGTKSADILAASRKILDGRAEVPDSPPELWDGQAAVRVAEVLAQELAPATSVS
ncbi:MAG: UDP-N-acetylglucosamine 2-epimerase (non-hydrolyzing) [Planctomycetota bacterium]